MITQGRKKKEYFIQNFHIWHANEEKFDTGFKEITNREFVKVLMQMELAGRGH